MVRRQASAEAVTLWLIFYNRLTKPNFDKEPGLFRNSIFTRSIRQVAHPALQKPPFRRQLSEIIRQLISGPGLSDSAQTPA